MVGIGGEPDPARLTIGVIGLLEALGRAHDAALVPAALLVAGAVERQQLLLAEACGLLENRVHQLARGLLVARQARHPALVIEHVEQEAEVVERSPVGDHGDAP